MDEQKITIHTFREMKRRGEKIAALTAYDFFTAKIMDEVGIEMILVGDSLGMAVLGYENTLPVTMEDMLHHSRAVARAKPKALVVGDMPFMTYSNVRRAQENAGRFIQAGAEAVKLEGGEPVLEQVRAVIGAGIPVLGHIGLLPQSILEAGGYKTQGRTLASQERLLRDAKLLEEAGDRDRMHSCGSRAQDHGVSGGPDHRHRRGRGLRRAGVGEQRSARAIHVVYTETRQTLRQSHRGNAQGVCGVQARRRDR
jgi:3-methyl-2-oxobutanoate hydroxymethyltransferase